MKYLSTTQNHVLTIEGAVIDISVTYKDCLLRWAWWHKPIILVLKRLRQKDCKLEVNLGYIMSLGWHELYCETLSQKWPNRSINKIM